MKEKALIPFFDCAYQGFATGDLDADAVEFQTDALSLCNTTSLDFEI